MKVKNILTIIAFLSVASMVFYTVNVVPLISDSEYTYISGFKWYNSYEEGAVVAKELNKPMLVYFWAIWCQFCEKLHTEVYPDPRVSKYLKEDFVLIAIDLDSNKEDTRKFGVQYPPYLLFLGPSGERITNIPGYISAEELSEILEAINEKKRQLITPLEDLPHS